MPHRSLTDFLLDRIAERDADIRSLTVWPEHVVMREIAFGSMLRYIVTTHTPAPPTVEDIPGPCVLCGHVEPEWPCSTIRAVATVHAGHPDFDPAWALSGRSTRR